jgi:hypothetical protein
MRFLIKFGGVTGANADGAKVVIRFKSQDNSVNLQTDPVTTHWDTGSKANVADFEITHDFLPTGILYNVYIKGEKHLSTLYCQETGQSSRCIDVSGAITVPVPTTSGNPKVYSFVNYPLKPGDLPPQDNVADVHDYEKIQSLLNKSCDEQTAEDKATADINYDGCVDVTDVLLMRTTLETVYDEN